VRAGHIHVGPTVATTLIERAACGRRSSRPPRAGGAITSLLGPREMTVFELIGRGHSTKEIAALLRISPKTVDTHRQRMRQKLRLPSATRLAALAITWSSNQSGVSPQP
jgi:DNA-binding CsgD family transcriptional regulator